MARTTLPPRVTAYAHAVHASGGMERAQREVVLGLLDRDWRVRVVARAADLADHENLEIVRVRVPERPAPLEQVAFATRAPRPARGPGEVVTSLGAIIRWPVDVVIVQYVNRAARGVRSPGGSGVRRALRQANNAVNHEIAVGLERWCYREGRARRFVPVSEQLREGLAAMSDWAYEMSVVIPNGVDLRKFAPDPEARARTRAENAIAASARLAVFVGGDWERKGLAPAIEALSLAPDWSLLVVGPGEQAPYRNEARRLGCADRLHFVGESRDPAPLLAAGDAFVLPTRYEGFPLSAIEAAASGLPLLLTRESNADGLLEPGETGYWVRRDPADIAARLSELGDPVLRARLGTSSRRVAERFSWPRIVDQHIAVYEEILAGS
jgi:glycosyltransferase involved in cell wall biosynthesis